MAKCLFLEKIKEITMKRIVFALSVLFVVFSFTACVNSQTPIKELEKIAKEVEENYNSYTQEDIDEVLVRLDAVEKEFDKYEYTDEELREIGRLNGRMSAYLTKAALNNLGSSMGDLFQELGGGIEGFMEAFGVESLDLDIDEGDLSDEELREAGRNAGKQLGKSAREFAIKLGAGMEGFAEEFEKEMEEVMEELEN